ncbi:MAG: hypothetical protein KDE28_15280, partial [Anaerolineales bacterium]|nr:hypothetical protein [Anaerolineales bacterium]
AAPLAETPSAEVSDLPVVRATTAPLQRQAEPAGTEPMPAAEQAATTPPIAIQRAVDSPPQPATVAQPEFVNDVPPVLPAAEQAPTTPITAAPMPQVSRQAEVTAPPVGPAPLANQPASPAEPPVAGRPMASPAASPEPTAPHQPTADLSELDTIVQRVPQTPAAPSVAAPPARAEAPADNRPSLESIWPVERIDGPDEDDDYKPPPPQPPALRLDQEKDVIRRALADVQPGEGTRAKVDLQLPRRGRPQRTPDASPPPPAPRQQPENHFPAPGAAAPTLAPAAPVTIQRAVDQAEAPARSELVQTEVGALPSDLWGYLGERAPIDTQATQHSSNDLMRFFDRAQPAGREMGDVMPPQIQRAVEIDEVNTRVEQSPADEEQAAEEGAAEPDIEKIAEQVYAELKRRLRLEWERAHGRFR